MIVHYHNYAQLLRVPLRLIQFAWLIGIRFWVYFYFGLYTGSLSSSFVLYCSWVGISWVQLQFCRTLNPSSQLLHQPCPTIDCTIRGADDSGNGILKNPFPRGSERWYVICNNNTIMIYSCPSFNYIVYVLRNNWLHRRSISRRREREEALMEISFSPLKITRSHRS